MPGEKSRAMIFFPNAKINLGLYITGKRSDGYHNLETVFLPIPYQDIIEVIPADPSSSEAFDFTSSGTPVEGPIEKNLCYKAWSLIKKDFPSIPAIKFHLHKAIPMGAGMGGGSADGAFALKLLNEKFNLQISEEKLLGYALQLGSDCPFFILNKPAFAKGRGEHLSIVQIPAIAGYYIATIFPAINISTAWAFSKIIPGRSSISITDSLLAPVSEWKNTLYNHFEAPVFEAYSEIEEIKKNLYLAGADYASLSGSGSTVFGLFKNGNITLPVFPDHYIVKVMKLNNQ